MRERYQDLIAHPQDIEKLLQAGAEKARAVASPFMGELRRAVGLRNLGSSAPAASKGKAAKAIAPAFKQYREKDGRFYFKLLDADARLLLQSQGFESPKEAASTIALLQKEGSDALVTLQGKLEMTPGISAADVAASLAFFTAA